INGKRPPCPHDRARSRLAGKAGPVHVWPLGAPPSRNINLLGTNSSTQSLVAPAQARAIPGEPLAPLPKLIYVELADYCNLSCTFCQRSTYVDSVGRGGFIDVDMLKKLEQPLRAAKYFGLSGRIGEPLLHPKLESILQWLYEINPGILLRIT